ncbi:MAG: hypothetical protein ACXQTR_06230 [Candidatus Methanospirareceae archaeon]
MGGNLHFTEKRVIFEELQSLGVDLASILFAFFLVDRFEYVAYLGFEVGEEGDCGCFWLFFFLMVYTL